MNLVSPLVNSISMNYERVMNKIVTIQVTGFYFNRSEKNKATDGFGITPEVRLYLSEGKNAPAGFFVAPYLTYQNIGLREPVNDLSLYKENRLRMFGGGICIGRQWVFKELVTFDIWAGPGYGFGRLRDEGGINIPFPFRTQSGFIGRIGSSIGVYF